MTLDQTRVIFLHNPRTGGITLRNALRRQFRGASQSIPRDDETRAMVRERRAAEARAQPDADEVQLTRSIQLADSRTGVSVNYNSLYLAGLRATWPTNYGELPLVQDHVFFGLHEHLPGTSTYITLIRDPVDRAVSTYFHHLREGRVRRSLEEYLRGEVMIDNEQTFRISGGSPTGGYESTYEMLDTAKSNLVEHFGWVGITERYEESLVLLRRTFEWRPLYFRRQNAAPRTAPGRLAPDLLAFVRDRNHLDVELHRFANELLDARLAADRGHAAELERFRRSNAIVGSIVSGMTLARDKRKYVKGQVLAILRDVGST